VLNQISRARARTEGCLGGLAVLEILWEGLSQRAGFAEEDRESATGLFRTARLEYDELVKQTVRRALKAGFPREAESYAKELRGELRRLGEGAPEKEAERVRKLEDALGVGPGGRAELRRGVLARLELAQGRKEPLRLADASLGEALDKMLLPSWNEAAKLLTSGDEQRIAALRATLMKEGGFPAACADGLIAYAGVLGGLGGDRRAEPRRLRWRS
jgi:hypothetical protein